jgi:hypothetical protein
MNAQAESGSDAHCSAETSNHPQGLGSPIVRPASSA